MTFKDDHCFTGELGGGDREKGKTFEFTESSTSDGVTGVGFFGGHSEKAKQGENNGVNGATGGNGRKKNKKIKQGYGGGRRGFGSDPNDPY